MRLFVNVTSNVCWMLGAISGGSFALNHSPRYLLGYISIVSIILWAIYSFFYYLDWKRDKKNKAEFFARVEECKEQLEKGNQHL